MKISVDSLRRTFDCTKKLKQFGQFRERVIDTAIKEINELSNLHVRYETIKTSNKISEIDFICKFC